MTSVPFSSLATASTLSQVASALGLPSKLTTEQTTALYQAHADLLTGLALQRVAVQIEAGAATNSQIATALNLSAEAQAKLAGLPTP